MYKQARAELFSLLADVNRFTIEVDSKQARLANGQGRVRVENTQDHRIIWRESGSWDENFNFQSFSNVYRWSFIPENKLTLEHLRYGDHSPVELVDLGYKSDNQWTTVTPFYCADDIYQLDVVILKPVLTLKWRIKGPKKDQMTTLNYS